MPIILFGTAWPVTKIGLAGATPVWFAAGRVSLSALASFALLLALRQLRWPTRRDWPIILSIGVFQLCLFFGLTNVALHYLPAGRSVVLANTTTLWLVPMALMMGESIPPLRWLGVAAGTAGVVVLANPWTQDWSRPGIALGHIVLLLAALSFAVAIVHARRHRWHLTPLQVLPWQMSVAAVLLILGALAAEPAGGIDRSAGVLAALFYIGVLAGPIATWGATTVARALPTVVSSLGFLGAPALGLVISTLWLGEPVTLSLALGSALIGLGLVLATLAGARSVPR